MPREGIVSRLMTLMKDRRECGPTRLLGHIWC
ncbi:enoyl-CoA hydratase [Reinekea sp. MED297]|uniref:Enoyl-CoA hydratase n=1 Tax=Reinekea blandensis MED297 TaxID=314283 RepID=A4B8T7_9GAMM|nr:enoyl-CoA hydratase [Reinekea sp. MED297] [Reinekea blandensis MED297]